MPSLWRASIELIEGEVLEIFSSLQIQIRRVLDGRILLFEGEWDTVGVKVDELLSFRIYQTGGSAA